MTMQTKLAVRAALTLLGVGLLLANDGCHHRRRRYSNPASQLGVIVAPPSAVPPQTNFAVQAILRDSLGHPVFQDGVAVSVALNANGSGAVLEGGPFTVTTTFGLATFTGISIDRAATGLSLVFTSPGLTQTVTGAFDVDPNADSPSLVPSAPTNLTGMANGPTRVDLTWVDNATNETSFKIERSSAGANTFTVVGAAPQNATTFSDITAASNTNYDYRVRATNSAGDSAPSNVATIMTPPNPGATTITAVLGMTNDVEWASVANATGYVVQRATADPFGSGALLDFADVPGMPLGSSVTGYDDPDLGSTDSIYVYRVLVLYGSVRSAPSNAAYIVDTINE